MHHANSKPETLTRISSDGLRRGSAFLLRSTNRGLSMTERGYHPLCLKCRKPFKSEGKYNRICQTCNRQNQQLNLAKCDQGNLGGGQHRHGRVIEISTE